MGLKRSDRASHSGAWLILALLAIAVMLAAAALSLRGGADGAPAPSSVYTPPEPLSIRRPVLSDSSQLARETVDIGDFGGFPSAGERYAELTVSGTNVACGLYYGDSEAQFALGAGTYAGAYVPGQGGAVLIGGHTGTYFRDLESAAVGADVCILARWGEYHYEIADIQVIRADDTDAYDLSADNDQVLLYTCYPFGQISPTPYRCIFYCDFVSGPLIA